MKQASDGPHLGPTVRTVRRAVQRVHGQGHAEIVVDESLPPGVVGRAVYRAWVEDPATQPLVEVDADRLNARTRRWAEDAAGHGLVLVRAGPDHPGPIAPLSGPRTLVERRRPAVPPTAAETESLLRRDAGHAEAVDPALAPTRRALLAHCRAGSTVSLVGEPGTGRASLAAWAHAVLAPDLPLRRLPGRTPGDGASGWLLVEDPADLEPATRHRFQRELESRVHQQPPLRPAHRVGVRPDGPAFDALLGDSEALTRVLQQASRAARTSLPVLILGEPGVGKELLGAAVHAASGRSGPLVTVDVGSLSADLIESELFGHVRGAFTGAERHRAGAFRSAHRGTLVLDELGNMPLAAQARLLRVLQQGEVRPVGSDEVIPVDVRVIASTNADLEAMVHRGTFREDLLRRLDAVTLRLPPLRRRGHDILQLAAAFAQEARGTPALPGWLDHDAARLLLEHPWPGNARELRHVVLRAVLEAGERPVRAEHLGSLARARRPTPCLVATTRQDLDTHLDLAPTLLAWLSAVTLEVPCLRDRGTASVRGRILHALDGTPISPDALDLLAALPWRGDLPELRAAIRVLASAGRPVEASDVHAQLPHLLAGDPRPICLLLHPVPSGRDGVTGFRRELHADVLLLGDLPEGGGATHGLALPVRSDRITPVSFPVLRAPGTVACLLARSEDGLVATRPADGPIEVRVYPLDGTSREQVLAEGQQASLGEAAELVLDRGDRRVQIFAFRGHAALERHGRQTIGRVHTPAPAPARKTASRPRIWRLDEAEIDILNRAVTRFRGGSFGAHLESALPASDPRARRLRAYILGVRPTQYCGRLYGYDVNSALREDLRLRLSTVAEPEDLLRLLPRAVRRHLGSAGSISR